MTTAELLPSAPLGAVLPPPVRAGDRVGVAALSGPADPGRLERGLAALAALGFEPVPAENVAHRAGLFAGDDVARLDGFHRLAADPSIRAILFVRGGHGVLRLLPRIDWDLLAAHPRAYVGYSDLTPLLLEVVRRLGLVAFHGPMVAADLARGLDEVERGSLVAALAGEYPAEIAVEMAEEDRVGPPLSGPLLGGCLSLVTALLGTPYAPRLDGSILFLEDVGEPLYRLDRMLTHLGLSGSLDAIHAMVFGQIGCLDAPAQDPAGCIRPLRQGLARYPWPVAWGLPAGHRAPNLTLPLGLAATLDPAAGRLLLGGAR
ncbi:MAG TPA: LD-carboxypeptidase [Thermoanaerobaculia bacterium]|nr:LD-carboxypeptidase [Thermoanaerobaculia bacterium]